MAATDAPAKPKSLEAMLEEAASAEAASEGEGKPESPAPVTAGANAGDESSEPDVEASSDSEDSSEGVEAPEVDETPPEFTVPEDEEALKRYQNWVNQQPFVQQKISEANAKGIRHGRDKVLEEQKATATDELQAAVLRGESDATRELTQRAQTEANRAAEYKQFADVIWDGAANLLSSKYGIDRAKLEDAADTPALFDLVVQHLKTDLDKGFEKRVTKTVEARVEAIIDKRRPSIPSPSRGPTSGGDSDGDTSLKGKTLAESLELAAAGQL